VAIAGDWSNSGSLIERSGTVRFYGSAAQVITNASGENFHNVHTANFAGDITLADDVSICTARIHDFAQQTSAYYLENQPAITGTIKLICLPSVRSVNLYLWCLIKTSRPMRAWYVVVIATLYLIPAGI
jgi:hypothetical protein